MDLGKLEGHSDRWLERLDQVGDEHLSGKRDDKSAMAQAGVSNACARQIGANLKLRKTKIAEAVATA